MLNGEWAMVNGAVIVVKWTVANGEKDTVMY